MSKCECGNSIEVDEVECEWCATPEVPIYKVMWDGTYQMECGNNRDRYVLTHDDDVEEVWAVSGTVARMIYADRFNVDIDKVRFA